MTPSTVTLLDVARAAGVSRTTASAALGGSGRISEQTRSHVQEVAASLGYTGNAAARHLRHGRAGVLGLHLPRDVGLLEYYMRFVFGAADTARDAGYALTILPSGHGASLNLDGVDGIVLVDALADDSSVEAVLGHSGPVVASERIPHRPDAAVVVVEPDHRAAISELFDHLIAQGAHRPAMIGAGSNSSWGARTADAYLAWCEERGIEPILRQTSFTAPAHVVGAVAGEMLDSEDPPDAIVSCPDGAALGVLDAARDRSILVGRDLLVGGTVDSTPFRYINPGITALDHHAHVVGRRCAEILLQWIQTDSPGDPPGPVKLDLTVRGSSGKRA